MQNSRRDDVREGVLEAKQLDSSLGCLGAEFFFIAIALGVWRGSWLVGGGAFVALVASFAIAFIFRPLLILLVLLLAALWGVVGWGIGSYFGNSEAAFVLAGVGALIAFGVHAPIIMHRPERR